MNDKECVARYAAGLVTEGMRVGLGTGSTANYFIEALAQRRMQGLRVEVVASSVVSAVKAQQMDLPVLALEQIDRLDLYVDGADEVAPDLTLLKGRGYDLVREKLLAQAAETFWVLIDASKWVGRIGERFPVPVEVMPFAWRLVQQNLQVLGVQAALRQNSAQDGLAITSHGSLVLDAVFADVAWNSQTIAATLNSLPGVVEHGIFQGLTDAVFVGANAQVEAHWATDKK